ANAGSRIRLCKGAYQEPESVAFQDGAEVDKSYVRCLKILMAGEGYPMVASHDPRIVEIAAALAGRAGREPKTFEYQMLYGVRPDEQQRIADRGDQMRVYIPFGEEWYGYLMRRMAERPANVGFFLRGLATKG
ncbi:MAG TPA: proline dehydrogenase family protein, partial [Dermatophilaceae bacterium]|nr:proline dehydrogenase family protein [Dermatophilaceae bacterium]